MYAACGMMWALTVMVRRKKGTGAYEDYLELQRALAADINQGKLPKSWNQYTVPASATLSVWMADFGM